MQNYLSDLNQPLLSLADKKDYWKISDAVTGAFIVGNIGSGKTSGSGQTIAKAYLKAGFGGLVLCAKPDECERWKILAAEAGRANHVLVMDGSGKYRFNFLDYEIKRKDGSSYKTPYAIQALIQIYEAMNNWEGGGGGGNERFWKDSVKGLVSHSIDCLNYALGTVQFNDLMRFIRSIPTSKADEEKQYKEQSFYAIIMETAALNIAKKGDIDAIGNLTAAAEALEGFFILDTRTRSNIIQTLESMILDFSKGDLRKIFCTDTNIIPEMTHEGAIIILDFPVKTWDRGGVLAQSLFKFAWQKSIERRAVFANTRPCFLWGDECQFFISSYDNEFLSTARSSKACSVYMTQSIPALRERVRGTAAADTINALLNNFTTRIVHTCLDDVTRTWAADCLGKVEKWRKSYSKGQHNGISESTSFSWNESESEGINKGSNEGFNAHHNGLNGGAGRNVGYNKGTNKGVSVGKNEGTGTGSNQGWNEGEAMHQQVEYDLLPSYFGFNLRKGGQENDFFVDGVMMQGGRIFNHNKKSYLICSFEQLESIKPKSRGLLSWKK